MHVLGKKLFMFSNSSYGRYKGGNKSDLYIVLFLSQIVFGINDKFYK